MQRQRAKCTIPVATQPTEQSTNYAAVMLKQMVFTLLFELLKQ